MYTRNYGINTRLKIQEGISSYSICMYLLQKKVLRNIMDGDKGSTDTPPEAVSCIYIATHITSKNLQILSN